VFQNAVPYSCSSDSDEEPVTKQPRLSRRRSRGSETESPGQSARSARTERAKRVGGHSRSEYCDHPVSNERTDQSDSDAFSENQSIGEGSYFEVCEFIARRAHSITRFRLRSIIHGIETLPVTVPVTLS